MIPTSFIVSYADIKNFTPRQTEILQLVLHGRSNEEIGNELDLTCQVVKNYLKVMFSRSGKKNRVSLITDVYDSFMESNGYKTFLTHKPQFDLWLIRHEALKKSVA